MNGETSNLKWMRLKEMLVTTIFGWLPTVTSGVILRNQVYRTIFKRIGKAVYIQDGVELIGAHNIEIGDDVYIYRGVRINAPAKNCKVLIGDRVALERGVDIGGGENCQIEIGERTFVGPYTCIGGPGHVKIGKHCLIAAQTGIIANNHVFSDPVQKIRDQGTTREGITIEDDCWLGYGVKVLDGVTIGQGSVIGAGAVVTKDIPPYSVAVGIPARVISNRKQLKLVKQKNRERGYTFKDNNRLFSLSSTLTQLEKAAGQKHPKGQLVNQTSSQLVFENLLHALLECIRQVMHVDTVAVLLRTDEQQLAVHATLGLEEEIETGVRIPIGQGFAGHIAARCELAIVDDLSQIDVFSPILRKKGLQSMLGVPLLIKDRVIGVFHVGTLRPRHFTSNEAQMMQSVAERISQAVEPLLYLWSPPIQTSSANGAKQ